MGHSNDDGFAICHISAGIGYCYCVVGSGPWISQYRYIQETMNSHSSYLDVISVLEHIHGVHT